MQPLEDAMMPGCAVLHSIGWDALGTVSVTPILRTA